MDADKIKDFFLFHVEKMILVVVVGASGFLLYQGFGLEHYTDKHQPDKLSTDAQQVKAAVDENHNDQIIPNRIPTLDIVAKTKQRYDPVDPSPYKLDHILELKNVDSIVRRQDPTLYAPRSLIAQGVIRSIAVRAATDQYKVTELEPADPVEKVEAPKVRPRKTRGRGRRNAMGGEGMGSEEDMMAQLFGEEGMEDDMMEGDMMEGMGMGMGEGTMAGGVRKFTHDHGTPPPPPTQDKIYPKPEIARFIAGAAVIPHKEMYRSFEAAFRDADSYTPSRDTPYYLNFQVQRADVTDKSVDELVDADWVQVWDRLRYTQLAALKWNSFAPEIVPADYREEITTWIPPVLLDDYRDFCLHPLIPMQPQDVLERAKQGDEPVAEVVEGDDIFGDQTELRMGPGQAGRGRMEGGMEMGMGEDDMMDMGDMMGMGMGMGMGGFGRPKGLDENPVDYKLIRFYDFVGGWKNSPKLGRKYVYRLRYSVNDPNFPVSAQLQPKVSSLTPETAKRVQGLQAQAQASNSRKGLFERWTEWSEPCEPVSLPYNEQYFAGPVQPASTTIMRVNGKPIEYQREPASAKIVASQYSLEYGTRVPIRMDVSEGSLLSTKVEFADVVDPLKKEVKKLPDAEVRSPTVVVGLSGGQDLQITDLPAPGNILLFNADGKLDVVDDIGDQELYRIHSFADERGE